MKTKTWPLLTLCVLPDQTVCPEWQQSSAAISSQLGTAQDVIATSFNQSPDDWLFELGFAKDIENYSPSLGYFARFSRKFIDTLSRIPELENLRQEVRVEISEHDLTQLVLGLPMITGAEYVNSEMLTSLWKEFEKSFSRLIADYTGTVESFFHARNPQIHLAGRVFFHLVENKNSELPFAFMATYSAGMGRNGIPSHLPLKHAIQEYSDDELLRLLSTVYKAGEKSELIYSLIDTGELFHPLAWASEEAFCFLKEIPLYEESGVLCRIPDWWKQQTKGAHLNVSFGDTRPSYVGMDGLVDFKPEILLGDTIISEEEARKMLASSEGLVFIKNKWVRVDREKLQLAIDACNKIEEIHDDGLSLSEAMRMQLNPEKMLGKSVGDIDLSVTNGVWLQSLVDKLANPDLVKDVRSGKGFSADLRPYQVKGLSWLCFLDSINFGACLADDMGLGKTLQILAFLSTFETRENLPASLLIVPASLISNWMDEIEKFYPSLKVHLAHPGFTPARDIEPGKGKELDRYNLVITSYALAQRYQWLEDYKWNYVILDEAQAIKNPGTKQTRAVKNLRARNRIIMTGTPVENKIADLWSLFDFVNPGLLGNKTEFRSFTKSLKDQPQDYGRLRTVVSPYILRRLKTDKTVIDDLPDKVEMKSFADLTKKQIVLYKKAVADLEKTVVEAEGIQRKGLVLASLMKFKQLCNHPDQLTGSGEYKQTESGKFQRLATICETIYEKRERVLVFTQFKEMTEPLRAFLETIFYHPGLLLHGSVAVARRKKLITTFQGEAYCPFMVLSLKAGGVGLNLTRANHVIHFDRWWNPAVENQATDRAFRIGQEKKVIVHKFITRGTIEEKIDMMLEDKQQLADQLVAPSGENLITEMDQDRLMQMFRLTI